jgi:NADH-quinone oxidoreductase subunit J
MVGLEHYLTVAAALFALVHGQFWALRHRRDIKRQNVLHQMWRDPAKAMELRDVKPGQGL